MSGGRDIGLALFLVGFGIWSFFWGFKRLRRKRMIENIPTSTVRGMAMGLTELIGKAQTAAKLISPLSKTECVFYQYTVERYERRGKSSRWVTIAQGDSSFSGFWLNDNTGKIMVLPKGAEIILPLDYQFTTGWGNPLAPNLIEFMQENGITYQGLFGSVHKLRFRERYIRDGEDVYVLGTAQKQLNALDEYNNLLTMRLEQLKNDKEKMSEVDKNHDGEINMEEWNSAVAKIERQVLEENLKSGQIYENMDVIITQGETEKIFIISDQSQKELTKSLSWQAFSGVFGGSTLTLITLGYLLFRLKAL